jgi:[ribosomal protein S5]-alanine N-acetyltransferase
MLLKTKRLTLRPFTLDDAERVQKLAGEWEIACMTANIPHPYPLEIAIEWIRFHEKDRKEGNLYPFAIFLKLDLLIGAISIKVNKEAYRAEMGYWIGKDFWGNGYTTEAAEEVLRFGFDRVSPQSHCWHGINTKPRFYTRIGESWSQKRRNLTTTCLPIWSI